MKHPILPWFLALAMTAGMISGCGSTASTSTIADTTAESSEDTSNDSLPNGDYTIAVTLEGGSGKASVDSPMSISVSGGAYTATVTWSSPNYDYMIVDGTQYDPVNTDGNSVFEIPVPTLDGAVAVQADTTAMSEAHLIDYTLNFDISTLTDSDGNLVYASADGSAEGSADSASDESVSSESSDPASGDSSSDTASSDEDSVGGQAEATPLSDASAKALESLTSTGSLELQYAQEFTVDTYEGGYDLISIANADYFLLVPEGGTVPEGLGDDVTVIQGPLNSIYVAASSAMDLFRQLGALDNVTMTATSAENWSIPEIKSAVESNSIQYVGKYSAPDYESIVSKGCGLAVESTMIYHSPEVKEQLETLGIPVMVEHSSYESDPLGRMEWIKLYGVLTGHLDDAEQFFDESVKQISSIDLTSTTPKSVVFFYISSSGYVNVRKPGDYISKMIDMAGGTYALSSIEAADDNSSTMNMQMEQFYAEAKDADILIYNSTTEGQIDSLSQLLAKSELLSDFKAVKEGNVWCTEQNMFQQTTGAADMVTDINKIVTGEAENETQLTFLHRVK